MKLRKKSAIFTIRSLLFLLKTHVNKKGKFLMLILAISTFIAGLSEAFLLSSLIPLLREFFGSNETNQIQNQNLINFGLVLSTKNLIIIIITTIFVATGVRLFTLWLSGRTAAVIGRQLGKKAFSNFLDKSYDDYLNEDKSKFIAALTKNLDYTVISYEQLISLFSSTFISLCIVIAIFVINKDIALFAILSFLVTYTLIIIFTRNRLSKNSFNSTASFNKVMEILEESIGGFRDILLYNIKNFYLEGFDKNDYSMRLANGNSNFLRNSPRILIEGVGLVTIVLIALYFLLSDQKNLIIYLTVLAVACQRVLPAFQLSYTSWATLKSYQEDVHQLSIHLNQSKINQSKIGNLRDLSFLKVKYFKKIILNSISYSYPKTQSLVLKNIYLEIPNMETIGIIGSSGSGKSTLLDILIGAISPLSGSLEIYFKDSSSEINTLNYPKWHEIVAHVPQSVYIANKSLAENISFSKDIQKINYDLLEKVIEQSSLTDFVNNLPKKYLTNLGDQGVSLSGGQKQRLAIARALYKQPKLLILDEPTSSLDEKNEKEIINTIYNLNGELTIILVTHKPNLLYGCKSIYKLKSGTIHRVEI